MSWPGPDGLGSTCRSLHVNWPLVALAPQIAKVAPRISVFEQFAADGLAFHQPHVLNAAMVNKYIEHDMAIHSFRFDLYHASKSELTAKLFFKIKPTCASCKSIRS